MNKINKHILMTGGTGLVGRRLTEQLLQAGYEVSHLSRSPGKDPRVKTYLWDVEKERIDGHCLDDADIIIHLAGAAIADKRWSDERKKELIESRTKSIELIYDLFRTNKNKVKAVISASAIGYYSDRDNELLTEESPPQTDFMAQCCIAWENAVDTGNEFGLRIVKFRTGVVLDKEGALAKLAMPVKLFLGSPLGDGCQWVPWVHWQDVVDMYQFAIENESLNSVFNMVAPKVITNNQLTRAVARQLKRPLWMPAVPAFVLKMLMGEMSTIVLGSTRVSAKKIEEAGFQFQFPEIELALKEIYG